MNSDKIKKFVRSAGELSKRLDGRLTVREAEFLACLPFLQAEGRILEIGSFRGKSTILLASVSQQTGGPRIVACDPFLLVSHTDPKGTAARELPDIFRKNLQENGVADHIEFHQMKSSELAPRWEGRLKALWIDGDHTLEGATLDFELFRGHLAAGAVVCLHDVLNQHEGPVRVFAEKMLLSPHFPLCGLCGSIGWGVFSPSASPSTEQWKAKLSLYRKVVRMVPFAVRIGLGIPYSRRLFKITRSRIPHRSIDPVRWLESVSAFRRA